MANQLTTSIPLHNKHGEIVAYTILDKDVADALTSKPWLNMNGYVHICVNNTSVSLHRYILGIFDRGTRVTHLDHNKLNNTRVNLFVISSPKIAPIYQTPTTSKYAGVTKREYVDGRSRWVARIYIGNKKIERQFRQESHAAYWYDVQVTRYKTGAVINGIKRPIDYDCMNDTPIKKLPRGVTLTKNGKYQTKVQYKGKCINLGQFASVDEASAVYEKAKHEIIVDKSPPYIPQYTPQYGINLLIQASKLV